MSSNKTYQNLDEALPKAEQSTQEELSSPDEKHVVYTFASFSNADTQDENTNEAEKTPEAQIDETPADTLEEQTSTDDPRIREEVYFARKYCTHLEGSECNRCLLACPHNAITISENSVEIDHDSCTNCGICIGICDAFSSARVTLFDLIKRVERIRSMKDAVYFTCSDHLFPGFTPHTNVVVLPCLAAVPPEFWACVLSITEDVYLYCDSSYCADCEVAGSLARNLFVHSLDAAQNWTDRAIQFSDSIPEKETLINKYAALGKDDNYDRRGMISSFAHEMTDIASGKHRKKNSRAVQEFRERQERMRAEGAIRRNNEASLASIAFPDLKEKRLWPRRSLLLQALKNQPQIAPNITLYTSTTNNKVCEQCKSCITACPTGARSYNDETNVIEVDASLCIICGICLSTCPHNACDYQQITGEYFATTKGGF